MDVAAVGEEIALKDAGISVGVFIAGADAEAAHVGVAAELGGNGQDAFLGNNVLDLGDVDPDAAALACFALDFAGPEGFFTNRALVRDVAVELLGVGGDVSSEAAHIAGVAVFKTFKVLIKQGCGAAEDRAGDRQ